MKVLRNVSLESFSAGDKVHLKAIEEINIAFCNTISSSFAKPQEHTDGRITP